MDKVPISLIQIPETVRQLSSHIGPLIASIKSVGLINPIYLNSALELLDGRNRLEAVKRLGWSTIDCIIWDRNGYIDPKDMEIRNYRR